MAINNTFQPINYSDAQKKTLGAGISLVPLNAPKKAIPSTTQPGGVISTSQYKQGNLSQFNQPKSGIISAPIKTSTMAPLATQPVTTQTTQPTGQLTGNQSSGTSYSGLTPSQIQTASPIRGLFPNIVSSLAASGDRNRELAQKAEDITGEYGKRIAELGGAGARARAGYLTTGTTPVAEGNAAVVGQSTSLAQQALTQGANMELAGIGKGLEAQGQTQSALGTAAGLAQPSVAAFGQTVFNPITGQYEGGGGLPPETMAQYAQMAANGQISAVPASITSNPVLNAQLNAAAKAINPNYNPIASSAQGQVLASIPALESANTAAEGIKNTITSYLGANPQLNASALGAANVIQQWVQGKQLTDPKYQTLFNYLDEYTNTLAPILGVGGSPTNLKTQIAQGFVNAAASGASISEVLNNMSKLASDKINNLRSGAVGGGVVSTAPTTGGSIWDF